MLLVIPVAGGVKHWCEHDQNLKAEIVEHETKIEINTKLFKTRTETDDASH